MQLFWTQRSQDVAWGGSDDWSFGELHALGVIGEIGKARGEDGVSGLGSDGRGGGKREDISGDADNFGGGASAVTGVVSHLFRFHMLWMGLM